MLKILWKRGEIAPEEQFLLLFTISSYLMLGFYVETRVGFSLRDKRLFQITEVEITRVAVLLLFHITSNTNIRGVHKKNQPGGTILCIFKFVSHCLSKRLSEKIFHHHFIFHQKSL